MSGISLDEVTKVYPERRQGSRRALARDRRRRVLRPRRPVRLRQVDAAAHDRRARGRHDRRHLDRRHRRHRPPPQERDIAMVFQNYALYPHMTVRENLAYGLKLQKLPKAEWQPARRRGREDARARRAARPQAVGALGRPAAARRDGPGDRARAEGVPDGRAALEPRREAARVDARRAREAARAARRDDRLRDARPGRGDDARAAGRRAPGRPAPAGRHAAEPLPPAR